MPASSFVSPNRPNTPPRPSQSNLEAIYTTPGACVSAYQLSFPIRVPSECRSGKGCFCESSFQGRMLPRIIAWKGMLREEGFFSRAVSSTTLHLFAPRPLPASGCPSVNGKRMLLSCAWEYQKRYTRKVLPEPEGIRHNLDSSLTASIQLRPAVSSRAQVWMRCFCFVSPAFA